MTTPDRLAKHVAKMKAGAIDESTVSRFMQLLRELLEERNEGSKYPVLRMFCDWALHTKLDRTKVGTTMLDGLDEMWGPTANADEVFRELRTSIAPRILQEQMIGALGSALVDPTVVTDGQICGRIVECLLNDLCGKPVVRKSGEMPERTAKLLKKGHRFMADRILFERDQNTRLVLVFAAKQIEPEPGGEVRFQLKWPVV